MDGSQSDGTPGSFTPVASQGPSRRKIAYVPLAQETPTYGGRDVVAFDEWHKHMNSVSTLRKMEEWGQINIDALTLSIRSRLSVELSWALTTMGIISTMKANDGTGFLVHNALELVEELLDLLEETAFGDEGEAPAKVISPEEGEHPMWSHREILDAAYTEGTQPFAALQTHQGAKPLELGPKQRPGDIILSITNIFRNLAFYPNTHRVLGAHLRVLPVMLRVASLAHAKDGRPVRAMSPVLSLCDIASVRKDVLHILANVGAHDPLSDPELAPLEKQRRLRRAYELCASFLIDVEESISPFELAMRAGSVKAQDVKVPTFPDLALEAFTRIAVSDGYRKILRQAIPARWTWDLFERLVHRLPLSNEDYTILMHHPWIGYMERVLMSLYSIAFFATPAMKRRARKDHSLGLPKILFRLIRRWTIDFETRANYREFFSTAVRRAVELAKIVDDGADMLDEVTTSGPAPALTFGMGYGEGGETKMALGSGMFASYQEDVGRILMLRDLDPVLFPELESLARVG